MNLNNTKKILQKYRTKNYEYLNKAPSDIKPDYSGKGIGLKPGEGYKYSGFKDFERDLIFNSIRELQTIVHHNNIFQPNADDLFLTEKEYLNELESVRNFVHTKLNQLQEIEKNYENVEHSSYPLNVCITNYRELNNLLDEIFSSKEYKEAIEPDIISRLHKENTDFKFDAYWRKRNISYTFYPLSHL